MTPFPGTVDFDRWEKSLGESAQRIDGVPITRYWLIPGHLRPKLYTPHPTMSPDEIRQRTQGVWDDYYSFAEIWKRAQLREVAEVAAGVRVDLEALPADVRQHRHRHRQRAPQESQPMGTMDRDSVPAAVPGASRCPTCRCRAGPSQYCGSSANSSVNQWRTHSCVPCPDSSRHLFAWRTVAFPTGPSDVTKSCPPARQL